MPNTKFLATSLVAAGLFLAAQVSAQDAPAANSSTTPPAAAKPAPVAKPGQTTGTKSASSTTAKPKTAPAPLSTQKQKASYAIGLNIGKSLKRDSVDVDPATLLRGLKDGIADAKPALTEDEAKAALTQLQTEVRAKQEEKAKVAALEDKIKGDAFLAANKTKEGVVTLPSGLQYKIITQGTGPKPAADDSVNCLYKGTLIDGTEFDSSAKHGGKPLTIPVGQVIKGWTEALQLMPVGSKWQLFIPSDLAYGERSPTPAIPPNSTLVFDIELVSIEPKKEAPKPAADASPDAQGTKPADKPKDQAPATQPPPKP